MFLLATTYFLRVTTVSTRKGSVSMISLHWMATRSRPCLLLLTDKVTSTTTERGVGHSDNDNMLLYVEGARIEVGLQSEDRKLLVREELRPPDADGIGDKLYNVGTDRDVWVAQQEQGVER
jgi:hypothetical protein